VYSARDTVTAPEPLFAELARAGWDAAVSPSYVWIGGVREPRVTLDSSQLYGWRTGAADAVAIRELVAALALATPSDRNHPRRALDQLAHVCACDLSGCEFEFESGELEEFEDEVPLPLRDRLRATRTQYVLRTSAGRSQLAVELQHAAWLALAIAVDGIRLDPQFGEWI
jgi:hypothetical protein